MKKTCISILGGISVITILMGVFALFVKLLQIGYYPDSGYLVLASRCIVVFTALPVLSSMFWLGLALILKYSFERIKGEKK
jgi:hypothetical protein